MDRRIALRHGTDKTRSQNNRTAGRTFEITMRAIEATTKDRRRWEDCEIARYSQSGQHSVQFLVRGGAPVEEQMPEAERKDVLRGEKLSCRDA